MKRLIFILTIFMFIFSLFFCKNNAQPESIATVWLMGSPTAKEPFNKSYYFEIYQNKTINIATGDIFYDTKNRKLIYHSEESISRKTRKANSKDWAVLTESLSELYKQDSDSIGLYSDVIEVTAFINERSYWTPYTGVSNWKTNEKLMEFTDIVLKISKL